MASVLLVEPSATLGRLHAAELEEAGHTVLVLRDAAAALNAVEAGSFDAVVSAVDMAPPGGYGLLRQIRADLRTSVLPFIFLSSHPPDVVRAGAGRCWIDGVVPKGVPGAVPAAVRAALASPGTSDDGFEGVVLLVDDSAVTRAVIRGRLEAAGWRVIEAADGVDAVRLAERTAPDAVVLDLTMPSQHGLSVLAELRGAQTTVGLPVVVLTADARTDSLVHAFDAGAEDYLVKSSDSRELVARLRSVVRRRRAIEASARRHTELEMDAGVDLLTGLATRARAEAMLGRSAVAVAREGRPMAIVLVDLDHFKAVNDTHGHAAGDQVLSAVGARILAALRTGDIAARWGGEEILVALPGAGLDVGVRRAEELRAVVADAPVRTDAGPLDVTASLGVSVLHGGLDVQGAVAEADAALYEAKHAGRNRVAAQGSSAAGSGPATTRR